MKKALTLAEVLIATVFLVVISSSILMLFTSCMLLNEANRNSTVAITHAQHIMEEIRDTSFVSVEGIINGGSWDLDASELADPDGSYGLVVLDSEIIDTSVVIVGDLLEVTVSVNWQDRRGRNRSEELITRIADYQ